MLQRLEIFGEMLRTDPINFIGYLLTTIAVVLISLILHECAHGYMALRCGDPTAKMMGRLSLNPLRHLDPIGTLCMFLLGFGWAKPVPVNPRNFRNYRQDDFLVSVAGIVTNLTLCILCALLSIPVGRLLWRPEVFEAMESVYGSSLGLFNVFGSDESAAFALNIAYGVSYDEIGVFFKNGWLVYVQRFLLLMMDVNLGLAIFNILPIPPLDGYHLLNDTLLRGRLEMNQMTYQISRVLLLVLIFSDVLDTILVKGSEFIGSAVVRLLLMLTGQL